MCDMKQFDVKDLKPGMVLKLYSHTDNAENIFYHNNEKVSLFTRCDKHCFYTLLISVEKYGSQSRQRTSEDNVLKVLFLGYLVAVDLFTSETIIDVCCV